MCSLNQKGCSYPAACMTPLKMAEVQPGMRVLDVGCGRGEIVRYCMEQGIEAYGIDYALAAGVMTRDVIEVEQQKMAESGQDIKTIKAGVCLSDAKKLPFPTGYFDRVLMFDVVEHLYPWELHEAMLEVSRVLKDNGRFIIHTAPNRWYDQYAYPWVRRFRNITGMATNIPKTLVPSRPSTNMCMSMNKTCAA